MRRATGLTAVAAIWLTAIASAVGQIVANGSFETPALSSNSFLYDPSGATWTFLNNAGIINAPGAGWKSVRFFANGHQSRGVLADDHVHAFRNLSAVIFGCRTR